MKSLCFLLAVLLSGCAAHRPRNVILISIDTLRADHLGSYGYSRDTSPNLDSLARAGTVYERARTNSSITIQSHMTMFTGLLPNRHRVLNFLSPEEKLAADIPTLTEILQHHGMETFWFGGENSPMLAGRLGFERGQTAFSPAAFTSEAGFAEVSRWIDSPREKPFFLFLHSWLPHSPYLAPKPYSSKFTSPDYRGGIIADFEEFNQKLADTDLAELRFPPANHPLFMKNIWRGNFLLSPTEKFYWSRVNFESADDFLQLRAAYDNSIFYNDLLLGRVLDQLRSRGLLDQTLLIVTSDHGEELYDHKGLSHFSHYEEVLHVPLILSGAGAGKNERIKTPVQLIDLAPTILERLGIKNDPAAFDGLPLPRAEGAKERPYFVYTKRGRQEQVSVEQGGYKLIRTGAEPDELYNLAEDPQEKQPLSPSRYPAIYRDLMQQQLRFLSDKK